jgi:hypothetical protein
MVERGEHKQTVDEVSKADSAMSEPGVPFLRHELAIAAVSSLLPRLLLSSLSASWNSFAGFDHLPNGEIP